MAKAACEAFSAACYEGTQITGYRYTLAESRNPLNVRFGSLADINASDEKGPLSGVKRT